MKQTGGPIEVVIIRRGKEASGDDIFQYLESFFQSDIERMREYVDIPAGSEIEKEVVRMTGMGQTIHVKEGEQKGSGFTKNMD